MSGKISGAIWMNGNLPGRGRERAASDQLRTTLIVYGADCRMSIATVRGWPPGGAFWLRTVETCQPVPDPIAASALAVWSTPPTLICTFAHAGGLFISASPVTARLIVSPTCAGCVASSGPPLAPVAAL